MKVTIALGGNALIRAKEKGTAEEQRNNVKMACNELVKIIKEHDVIITHGNGPQVGNLQIQNDNARNAVPPMPLYVCVAMTQGQIGFMLQQQLNNKLVEEGVNRQVVTLVTQLVVDKNDPAFDNPTKPIGPFYTEEEAREFMKEKKGLWVEDSGRGWRKVVPSPQPINIVEQETIKDLVEQGLIIIAGGGGGIPVIKENGNYVGIEAVIDKDLGGELLARLTGSDLLLILTDVSNVALNYKKPGEKMLTSVTIEEIKQYEKEGHFKAGSMGPKVKAALNFLECGGKKAIITSLEEAYGAINGYSGTHIVKD